MKFSKKYTEFFFFPLYWAVNDIKQRYRRSVLGPFWITLSSFIFIISLTTIYHKLFQVDFDFYILWVTTGIIPWFLFLNQVNEGMYSIIEAENIIKSHPININNIFLRLLFRNFIIFIHNFLIVLFIIIIFSDNIFLFIISLPLTFILYFVILFPTGGIVAILCTRFRDLQSLISSLIQIVFLISPIIWHPSLLQGEIFKIIIDYNPIYHFLEIIRSPIFENKLPFLSYFIILSFSILLNFIFIYLYKKKKDKIIFWI